MHALSPDVSADAGVPSRRPPALAHLGPAALFAALSMLLTWPLAVQVSTHIPGDGFGDAVVFFWNEWWMRHVLAGDGLPAFLSTDALFYPGGVDLALHTHTALNSLAAATLLGAAPLADALNLTILANGALNGFAAYLLAWRLTGHRLGSIHGSGLRSGKLQRHALRALPRHGRWWPLEDVERPGRDSPVEVRGREHPVDSHRVRVLRAGRHPVRRDR